VSSLARTAIVRLVSCEFAQIPQLAYSSTSGKQSIICSIYGVLTHGLNYSKINLTATNRMLCHRLYDFLLDFDTTEAPRTRLGSSLIHDPLYSRLTPSYFLDCRT
jgi:hypothetical protein